VIFDNTEEAVDYMLRGWLIQPEIIRTDGNLLSPYKATAPIEPKADAKNKKQKKKKA
jgi:hypothetical protein